jgi:hypothetical protein
LLKFSSIKWVGNRAYSKSATICTYCTLYRYPVVEKLLCRFETSYIFCTSCCAQKKSTPWFDRICEHIFSSITH